MNVVADDRLSRRYSVIHTRLDYVAQVLNEPVQPAEALTGDMVSCLDDTSEAGSLVESPGAASPSAPGPASRKTRFSRTPISADPNFRRIAMG